MKSRLGQARLRVPKTARRGEIIEIRALVEHPMESGFRHDNMGRPIPRHIATDFDCHYGGRHVFHASLHPAVSTNPYFLFYLRAIDSGELLFVWRDDLGGSTTESVQLSVS